MPVRPSVCGHRADLLEQPGVAQRQRAVRGEALDHDDDAALDARAGPHARARRRARRSSGPRPQRDDDEVPGARHQRGRATASRVGVERARRGRCSRLAQRVASAELCRAARPGGGVDVAVRGEHGRRARRRGDADQQPRSKSNASTTRRGGLGDPSAGSVTRLEPLGHRRERLGVEAAAAQLALVDRGEARRSRSPRPEHAGEDEQPLELRADADAGAGHGVGSAPPSCAVVDDQQQQRVPHRELQAGPVRGEQRDGDQVRAGSGSAAGWRRRRWRRRSTRGRGRRRSACRRRRGACLARCHSADTAARGRPAAYAPGEPGAGRRERGQRSGERAPRSAPTTATSESGRRACSAGGPRAGRSRRGVSSLALIGWASLASSAERWAANTSSGSAAIGASASFGSRRSIRSWTTGKARTRAARRGDEGLVGVLGRDLRRLAGHGVAPSDPSASASGSLVGQLASFLPRSAPAADRFRPRAARAGRRLARAAAARAPQRGAWPRRRRPPPLRCSPLRLARPAGGGGRRRAPRPAARRGWVGRRRRPPGRTGGEPAAGRRSRRSSSSLPRRRSVQAVGRPTRTSSRCPRRRSRARRTCSCPRLVREAVALRARARRPSSTRRRPGASRHSRIGAGLAGEAPGRRRVVAARAGLVGDLGRGGPSCRARTVVGAARSRCRRRRGRARGRCTGRRPARRGRTRRGLAHRPRRQRPRPPSQRALEGGRARRAERPRGRAVVADRPGGGACATPGAAPVEAVEHVAAARPPALPAPSRARTENT